MNFRSRVIATTVLVAAASVILACVSAYVTTSSSLLRAVDESLSHAAASSMPAVGGEENHVTGAFYAIVFADGRSESLRGIPVDATIMAVAKGQQSRTIRTVVVGGTSLRELIVPLRAGTTVACETGICRLRTNAAQLFIVNVSGQQTELRHLAIMLILIAIGGSGVALSGGLWLARRALVPLEAVTDDIEEIADTTDLSLRLRDGGDDELGRLRRVFNRLLTSVESSQSQQRQLVMDASHELRTPLTSLRTNAQVMSRAKDLTDEDIHQITADMVTQVDELAALIGDLAELARGERSEGSIDVLSFDELVEEQVETARTYARVKNIDLRLTTTPGHVRARRDRLARAVSNLLTNAVKFTPEGGVIAVTVHGGTVTVSDSGPGIAPEDRPRVFERFWRSPSARAMPGSGLGLSIVAQVAAECHGVVRVDQDPDLGGARLTMSLPVTSIS